MRLGVASSGLLALLVAGLSASWLAGSIMVAGHTSYVPPALPPAQDVRFDAADGVTIVGTFRPGRNDRSPGVLLLHGVDASRQATVANAAWLSGLGYATLAIDFRGHGQSTTRMRTFGLREADDARAAFDWLKRQQHGAPVAVIGISLGGAASLIGDRGPIPADAMILQAVYPDIRHAIRNRIASRLPLAIAYTLEPLLSFQAWPRFGVWPSRLAPLTALPRYHGPVLVIGGMQDQSTPPTETRQIFAAVTGKRAIWLVPTGDHAAVCDLDDPSYRRWVRTFLAATIGQDM